MQRKEHFFETKKAYVSANPLSQALRRVECKSWFILSGQLGIDPESGKLVEGGARAETVRTMENIKTVLEEAGLSMSHIVKSTIYTTHLNKGEKDELNEVYASYFDAPYPARSMV